MDEDTSKSHLQLKADLLEQDHRIFNLLRVLFAEKGKWPKNDLRHQALHKALVWQILFRFIGFAAIGGIVAIVSLAAVLYQSYLLRQQNNYLLDQIKTDQIDRHMQILLADADEYTNYQKEYSLGVLISAHRAINADSTKHVNLRGVDLRGANLSGMDLRYVDFSTASLSGANLSHADLTGAILFSTDLSGRGHNFSWSNMNGPNAHGDTTFFHTKLKNADLSGAFLDGAIFYKADLSGITIDPHQPEDYETVYTQERSEALAYGLFINCIGLREKQLSMLKNCYFDENGLETYINKFDLSRYSGDEKYHFTNRAFFLRSLIDE